MTTKARSQIENLPPYSFANLELTGEHDRIVQLAQNELAIAPSPGAVQAASDAIGEMNRYSDGDHVDLRKAIAQVHHLNPEQVLCGAGSLELMSLIATAYCDRGVDVIVSQYGYKFFQVLSTVAGANLHVVPEPDMQVDIDGIGNAVNDSTQIVFVVNPGNPTGACLEPGAVRELRTRIPDRVMLILDCAYGEFADGPEFENGFNLVDEGENIVVLRTFSKAYGLAGMRVGWGYAPHGVVSAIQKIRPPGSITSPALAAAEAAVLDRKHLHKVCEEIAELRLEFTGMAKSLGLSVLPSATNFVLFSCPGGHPIPAEALNEKLRERGVILRPMQSYELPDHLRITIGSREEMGIVRKVFTDLLS